MLTKKELLSQKIEHVDITRHDPAPLVEAMRHMAYSARDLARAAEIYDSMLADRPCGVILCLAGSLVSAGLKKVFLDLVRNHMVDVIVSTGANIVDQDFFEALGFHHYQASERLQAGLDDDHLRELRVNRIYDTLIDEDELRICDDATQQIADSLPPRAYSSREFIREMGSWLVERDQGADSIVRAAYEEDVPIFCPAFSDCSAGFGLLAHQHARGEAAKVAIDSVKDFYELAQIKAANPTTGIFIIGGGVPKNFTQDVVVATEALGEAPRMHKYAVQVTVADVRDGALSSSTLKEASSWGKVDTAQEQMVYSEATLAVPLIAGYAYHKGSWKDRQAKRLARLLEPASQSVS